MSTPAISEFLTLLSFYYSSDLTFILVSTPHSIFASHGHKLIIIAPIIEGLLGGWSTLQAATSASVNLSW